MGIPCDLFWGFTDYCFGLLVVNELLDVKAGIFHWGFKVGRITDIGQQKFNLSAEALWVPKHSGGGSSPERGVKLGFVWLLPE